MKKYILILVIFSQFIHFESKLLAQSVNGYQTIIDSLRGVQEKLLLQHQTLEKEIEGYQNKIMNLNFEHHKGSQFIDTKNRKGYLMSEPNAASDIILKIPSNSKLLALTFDGKYWKVKYENFTGYITDLIIKSNAEQKNYFLNKKESSLNLISNILNKIIIDTLWINNFETTLFSRPNSNSPINITLCKGEAVYLIKEKGNWYNILFNSPTDIQLSNISFTANSDTNNTILSLFDKGWIYKSKVNTDYVKPLSKSEKRCEAFIRDNPNISDKIKKHIRSGSVIIGMNKDMVLASWGKPNDINRTVHSFGVHEQWIYNEQYLYFEDGVLKSFQD